MSDSETTPVKKQRSYFVKNKLSRYVLDDGESFIEHKKLDEGLFQSYQDLTSRIKLDAKGESTEVDMALGRQRRFLLEHLVEGWNLVDEEGDPIRFTPRTLFELPPEVIAGLIEHIYKVNPVLGGDDEDADASKD